MKTIPSSQLKMAKNFPVDNIDVFLDGSLLNDNIYIFPGFCDVHVHFREPGFSYKETIKTGSMAAARGGFTTVCTMPNLNPVPDNLDALTEQLEIINADSVIRTVPYGAITKGQKGEKLADLEDMAPYVVGFSDDGHGVQKQGMMLEAMKRIKSLGKTLVAHCEDNSLVAGGYIHKGKYAEKYNHKGICSESEWVQIERDIKLAAKTGCPYHVCHISTKESVSLIKEAKKAGIDVTCETAPHYLILDENCLKDEGRFKMNPPLRGKEDRMALLEGIADGTIDMIATDHAPHSAEEKSKGLKGSSFGIVGLETSFPLIYTYLVKKKIISLEKLIELMVLNPRRRFGLEDKTGFTVWDLGKQYEINTDDFLSKGKSTPFEGMKVYGKCLCTVIDNKYVFQA